MARNVYDVTLSPTDLVHRGLLGPTHTAELSRDVWISGHNAWLFYYLHVIWKELESMELYTILMKWE